MLQFYFSNNYKQISVITIKIITLCMFDDSNANILGTGRSSY